MALVTLIGEKQAKKGNEFTYLGPINECKGCKLKNVCFNLKPGRRYKIKKIREKRHECKIHSGKVAVVEVEELPLTIAIDRKLSEGATTKIKKDKCNNIGCKNYNLCKIKLQKDKKYKIIKIYGNIECPIGRNLQKAEITDG